MLLPRAHFVMIENIYYALKEQSVSSIKHAEQKIRTHLNSYLNPLSLLYMLNYTDAESYMMQNSLYQCFLISNL